MSDVRTSANGDVSYKKCLVERVSYLEIPLHQLRLCRQRLLIAIAILLRRDLLLLLLIIIYIIIIVIIARSIAAVAASIAAF